MPYNIHDMSFLPVFQPSLMIQKCNTSGWFLVKARQYHPKKETYILDIILYSMEIFKKQKLIQVGELSSKLIQRQS